LITTADKLNLVLWAFSLFSALILLWIALSWRRRRKLSLFNKAAILIVLLGMASFVDAYWIEPNWLETEEVIIHDPKLAEVLEGIRVVQISDIHVQGGIQPGAKGTDLKSVSQVLQGGSQTGVQGSGGQVSNLSPLERDLIAQVNALKPDLLFITGDFFSGGQKLELAAEVAGLSELIRSFKTTSGIFGVQGNYDGPLSDPAIMKEFKAAGIDILINENRAVALPNHKTLYLAGFNDSWNKRAKLKAFSGIPPGAPVVLLAHEPDNFDEAIGAGVNLLLVGHTHGGQIGIPFLIKKSNSANKSSFMSGLFDAGKTKMYVNRGIATTHIPVRFFNRPEITLLEVRK
jgi:predicted MPP superfamily phosphohydrolase